jgi:thiol:disulfide interchange protein
MMKQPDFAKKIALLVPKISKEQIQALLNALCHPGWYQQAGGFSDALSVAQTNNEYVLVAFTWYTGCGYCKKLKSEVFDTCSFGMWRFQNGLELADIDVSNATAADMAIVTRYHIAGYPTVLALNPDGTERGRVVGYSPGTGVHNWIQQFAAALGGNTTPPP